MTPKQLLLFLVCGALFVQACTADWLNPEENQKKGLNPLTFSALDAERLRYQEEELRMRRSSFSGDDSEQSVQLQSVGELRESWCSYPCILNNGCKCNHTKVQYNMTDNQWYGTCTKCNKGWTGGYCDTVAQDCFNGGEKLKNGTCECGKTWQGPQCATKRCINSVGGKGPNSVVPSNAYSNMCSDCKDGWKGIACELCTKNNQCPKGHTCDTSTIAHSRNKRLYCNLTGEKWLNLFSNDRHGTHGRIVIDWKNDQPWNQATLPSGEGFMSLWRVEPGGFWLDPFFYCSTKTCTMTVKEQSTPAVLAPMPASAKPLRWAFTGVMYICLFFFIVNGVVGWLFNIKAQIRIRIFVGVALMLMLTLATYLGFAASYGHQVLHPAKVEKVVEYACDHSGCNCAADPPPGRGYDPTCDTSTFQKFFLPALVGKSRTVCTVSTGECYFTHENLAWEKIPLDCIAAECKEKNASSVEAEGLKAGTDDTTAITAGSVIGGVGFLLLASFLVMHTLSNIRCAEFHAKYSSHSSYPVDTRPPTATQLSRRKDMDNPQAKLLEPECKNDTHGTFPGSESEGVIADSFAMEGVEETVTWVSLRNGSYHVGGKQILKDVHMSVKSGEMLAIMGPSGAGKTTLLDILTKRSKVGTTGGELLLNGVPLEWNSLRASWAYKRMIGYVAQEENLIAALTVRQTIRFAARLKLPVAIPDTVVDDLVEDVIEKMHLTSCAETLVGNEFQRGVSGGEKRRVSIATELVANPRILFLDEPTSGLDSVSAHEVMRAITNLTKKTAVPGYHKYFSFRPAIVFSIHQPSSDIYNMFDRVMLLSKGSALYFGPANLALDHVRNVFGDTQPWSPKTANNPAEILLRLQHDCTEEQYESLVASPRPAEQVAHDEQSPISGEADSIIEETQEKQKYYPDMWQQFFLLSKRSWASLMGSYYLIMCHSVAVIFLGITLSFMYKGTGLDLFGVENKAGMVTFFLLVMSFSSLSCLDLFIGEKKLFNVERENGYYSTLPYFCTKVIFDFVPLRIIPTVVLSSAIYFPMGLRTDGPQYFLWFVGCSTLFSTFVTGYCFIVAILSPSFGAAALFSSLLILWNTAFGGLMVQAKSLPDAFKPCRLFSPFYFAYEAMMTDILDGLHCVFDPDNQEGHSEGVRVPIPCRQMLENLGLHPQHFRRDVTALICGTFATLVLAFLLLLIIRERK